MTPPAADRRQLVPIVPERQGVSVGAALASMLLVISGCRTAPSAGISTTLLHEAGTLGASSLTVPPEGIALARDDPLAFLRSCIDRYDREVKDYRCTFVVRERLHAEPGPEQVMAIKFREQPFSVDVRWIDGAIGASHVNYVAGRSRRGTREMAYIKPTGVLGLLTPGGVMRHIHAADVRAAARRTIDLFGFRNTLALYVEACERAEGMPGYALEFAGIERFDDHPCFVFERRLPYHEGDAAFPDRLQRLFVDAEWCVPRASFAYSDDDGGTLLGSYIARDIVFNVGLGDDDFHVPRVP